MKYQVKIYGIVAIVCFLGLALVQVILLYNTYERQYNRFYYDKKGTLAEVYARTVTNDKIFPGAQPVIDSIIIPQYRQLETLYTSDRKAFDAAAAQLMVRVYKALHHYGNADSLLNQIREEGHISEKLYYAFCIHRLQIKFSDHHYINLYDPINKSSLIPAGIQCEQGLYLTGNLRSLNENNRIITLSVSSATDYSYAIGYSFYAEPYDRQATVLQQIKFTIILTLLSLLAITALFIVTMRNWLRQKLLSEMKSDFINSITHEFNTPLTAIIVANKSLRNEKTLGNKEAVQGLSDIIGRQSDRLRQLIGQVLEVATINRLQISRQRCNLHQLTTQVLDAYRLKVTTADIQFSGDPDAADILVEVDTFHFTTFLQNMLDNALKYNRQEHKQVTIHTMMQKNTLELRIEDNGIGMHQRTIRHIFDKFYRDPASQAGHPKGLGLGLYYVKQFVEAHKWKITVESEQGKGSTFILTIPNSI
ncbi:MAG TPA: HAMP domain-containing sensor histidine kinase [Chitinophaga sp.]|uniref:sensor histidine kinase n=1 Tax=Chitinophaga sp. TaxID=1869181 RepID=UPI002CA71E1A|nr:HAMP domain-containing sensor histidine kinase [Chitinophaga sp.]HVI48656.1 HAMP domain-containing sensor histidine kinase [Chitinophaga sp.]